MLEAATKYGNLNPNVISGILETELMVLFFTALTKKTNLHNLLASR